MRVRKILLPVILITVISLPAFSQTEVLKVVVNNLARYKQKQELKYLTSAKKSIDSLFAVASDSLNLELNVYLAVTNSALLYADSASTLSQPAELLEKTAGIIDRVTKRKKAAKFKSDIEFAKQCLANVYLRRGFAAINQLDYFTAERHFLSAKRYAPDFKKINDYLAYTNARQGNLPAASRYYDNLINAGTLNADQVETASGIYKAIGDTVKALGLLQRYAKTLPKNEILLSDQANIYNNKRDYASLENLLPLLLKSNGNNPDIVFVAANCYDRLGNFDEAEALYLKAIDLNSSAYSPVINLGLLYLKKSAQQEGSDRQANISNAADWLQKASEMSPNDINCLEALRLLYQQAGNSSQLNKIENKLKQLTN